MIRRPHLRNGSPPPRSPHSFRSALFEKRERTGVLFHPTVRDARRREETTGRGRPLKFQTRYNPADDGARNYAEGFDAWILAARSARNRPLRASSAAFTLRAPLFLVFLLPHAGTSRDTAS